jgi:acyl-coenzyme A synthetase/AMP-(fatty) acid ligase
MKMAVPVALPQRIAGLLTPPPGADRREFTRTATTVGQVYAMAAWLRAKLPERREQGVICLAAEDRAVIAAAMLASLAGGPVLLLPYAFSRQALASLHRATGFTLAIGDVPRDLPPGTEIFSPQPGDSGRELDHYPARPEEELLRLYTGGSTGEPQIWPKTGSNLFAEALFLADHFAVSGADRIVATISPYHVYGLLYSVLLPLVSGATVMAATPAYPEEIQQAVANGEATVLVSVPAHYRTLLGRSALGSTLRLAFSSAGVLACDDNRQFSRANPAGIVEVYGSTETGGIALRNRSRGEDHFTPYPTVTWQINREQLRIRSPYLSPTLTLAADGSYLTGDRVEAWHGGGFTLKGRSDSIIKVAGKRVDLEEITTSIRQQPGVADCLVLALAEGGGRENRIVAVVEGAAVDVEALRRSLACRFEPYALPRAIKLVSRIPLKDHGKYDRAAILRLFAP